MTVATAFPHERKKVSRRVLDSVRVLERRYSLRIKISLDQFFVHAYPGKGEHTILCEFAGKHQVAGEVEELRFALRMMSLRYFGCRPGGWMRQRKAEAV
ncbi:hypothetical protein CBA19CS22_16275 [Caballeronia novacaledonica]|uniref:Uncharacterized protein n=2 Tax=Caballeronia novacaledonica TaxID=1544861 RepID=A0AA37IAM5_9BURK|nr:hypothetical protein [Caballeronia novacaledonica]GJH18119.1 hypothetical protein CBA19CS22_16275 [Caballeronia novacaledonica]GJH25868.1 hypothetical protein CBA19CS42_15150 [Caballeronia novacaledonica]